jgi:hypothetical protein
MQISALLLLFSLILYPADTFAQLDDIQISPLSQGDIDFMDKQRQSLDELARRYLGMRLRNNKQNDLEILQKLLDQQLVKPGQTLQLQAMGIILGDTYVRELGVHWVVLHDEQGRSRALQWINHKDLLFPVTMISRRVEAGLRVDVNEIYQKGYEILEPMVKKGVYR